MFAINCPACGKHLKASQEPPVGSAFQCPKCGAKSRYQPAAAVAPATVEETSASASKSHAPATMPIPAVAASTERRSASGSWYLFVGVSVLLIGTLLAGGFYVFHNSLPNWIAQRKLAKPTNPSDPLADWFRQHVPEASFSVLFPDEPKRTEVTEHLLEETHGETSKEITYVCKNNRALYQVIVGQLTPKGRQTLWGYDRSTWRKTTRDSIVVAVSGTQVLREREFQLGDFPCLDITTRFVGTATVTMRTHAYLFSNQLVSIVVSSVDSDAVTSPSAEQFLGSVRLDNDPSVGKPGSTVAPVPNQLRPGPTIKDDHRYQVYTDVLSWHDAKHRCEQLGGKLATVNSQEQNQDLARLVKEAGLSAAWLGASDEESEGRWMWIDGNPISYSHWATTQPNNKGGVEHYLLLMATKDGGWADQPDVSTEHKPGFIVQLPK